MNKQYLPEDFEGKLVCALEEMAEASMSICKVLRFGSAGVDPRLPLESRETNAEAVLREFRDVRFALRRVEEALGALDAGSVPQKSLLPAP